MFAADLADGAIGERAAWDKLQHMQGIRSVVDVRDDKFFQDNDVDFLVESYSRQFVWVEVKTDRQADRTGNIAYEVSTSGNEGCLKKTKAAVVFYYLPNTGKMYSIKMRNLRNYIVIHEPKLVNMGDASTGYLLSIKDLLEYGVMKEI